MKRLIAGLALALTFGAAEAYALDVDLACPSTVKIGKPLAVTVYLKNWDYSPVTVSRSMAFLAGNSTSNTFASVGLWGPFHKNGFGTKIVPGVNQNNWTPGTVAAFNITVINAVPNSLAGKMAVTGVDFLDSSGRSEGGNSCMVSVTN